MRMPWTKKSVETKSQVLGLSDALSQFILFGSAATSGATARGALNLYETSTAVSIPVNMVASCFASFQPVLIKDDEIITDHEVLDLLMVPSPYYTQELLLEVLAKNYLITGETELIALGNINSPPTELQPITPDVVTVDPDTNGLPTTFTVTGDTLNGDYIVDRKSGRVRYLDGNLRELKQIRGYSTKNNSLLQGQSLLLNASKEVRQHILGNTHNAALLENGGRISLVFNYDAHLSDDDFEATKAGVRAAFGGAKKAGGILVTNGQGLSIEELGTSNKDMDFVKLQEVAKRAVALQYRVPLPLIALEATSFNNYEAAKVALYDDAVVPLANIIFSGLSDLLLPRFGIDPREMQLSFDPDAIPTLRFRRNTELQKRFGFDIETINEKRQLIGRDPIEGGDKLPSGSGSTTPGINPPTTPGTPATPVPIPEVVEDEEIEGDDNDE